MTWVPPLVLLARYVIALAVARHGITYLVCPTQVGRVSEAWRGSSWLLGTTITGKPLKTLTIVLWAIAGVGFIVTGTAIAFTPLLLGSWRPLAIGASSVAVLSFAAFWDGQMALFASQGGIGMLISVVIFINAIVLP